MYQYSAILPPLVVASWLVYSALYSPASLDSAFGKTFLFVLLPAAFIASGVILSSFGGLSVSQMLLPFIAAVAALLVILAAVWFYTTDTFQSWASSSYLQWTFGIAALFIGLAILWPLVSTSVARLASQPNSWLAFFLQVVFYIPCMIRDAIRYLGEQVGLTPPITFVLLGLEALVLAAFFAFPAVYRSATGRNLVAVVPGAVFLNEMQVVANSDMTTLPPLSTSDLVFSRGTPAIRRNYAWTMWVYINDYDRTRRVDGVDSVRVFEYARGNPAVHYNKTEKVFDIRTTNAAAAAAEPALSVRLATQKWIMLGFNYRDNRCDIFIDGVLAHSDDTPSRALPEYGLSDVVMVGDDGGIDGAICNVEYHLSPLTQAQIAGEYNLLRFSNPPVWDAKKLKGV